MASLKCNWSSFKEFKTQHHGLYPLPRNVTTLLPKVIVCTDYQLFSALIINILLFPYKELHGKAPTYLEDLLTFDSKSQVL